jgi:hypothetical protein
MTDRFLAAHALRDECEQLAKTEAWLREVGHRLPNETLQHALHVLQWRLTELACEAIAKLTQDARPDAAIAAAAAEAVTTHPRAIAEARPVDTEPDSNERRSSTDDTAD